MCWAPNGTFVASCARDGTVRVYELPTAGPRGDEQRSPMRLLWSKSHEDEAKSVRFSRDGKLVASGGRDCRVHLWNAADGTLAKTFFGPSTFRSIAFSRDGRRLAAVQTSAIHIFHLDRQSLEPTYLSMDRFVRRVLWLDDDTVISGDEDGTMRLWSVVPPRATRTVTVDGHGIRDLDVRGNRLVIGGKDGGLRLWSVTPLQQVAAIGNEAAALKQTTFFLGERFVAAVVTDGSVRLYDRESGVLNCAFSPPPVVNRIAAHPTRPILAAAVGTNLLVVDVDVSPAGRKRPPTLSPPPTKRTSLEGPISMLFLASNPDAKSVLRVGNESRAIKQALNASTHRERWSFTEEHAVRREEIQKLLVTKKPTIVHFSGHGSASGGLRFESDGHGAVEANVHALAETFRILQTTRIVVLNACYSKTQAQLLQEHVDAVIGMDSAIPDETAIEFARAFYEALAETNDIEKAFELARNNIVMTQQTGYDVPELLLRRTAVTPP